MTFDTLPPKRSSSTVWLELHPWIKVIITQ